MTPRPFTRSLTLLVVTLTAGLVVRLVPLGLPPFLVKYAGSMLWALMIYWIVSALFARWRLLPVGLLAGGIATTVEFLKLYHAPVLDAFRLTLPGILVLGRHFSLWDIVAYWIAIGLGAYVDGMFRPMER
ncbi:MAG: DUF2809 domain-containing protein [Acidobacteriaceae bacterium]